MSSNKKISELNAASNLDGTENFPIAKAGLNFKATIAQIKNFLGLASTVQEGLMSKDDKAKLNGVAANATKNAADSELRDRSTHTGTQDASTVSGLAKVATSGVYGDLTGKPDLTPNGLGAAPASHVGDSGTGAHPAATESQAGFMPPTAVIAINNLKNVAFTGSFDDLKNTPFIQKGGHSGFSWFANSNTDKGQTLNDYNSNGTASYVPISPSGASFKEHAQFHKFVSTADTYSIAGLRSAQPMFRRGTNNYNGGFIFEAIVGWDYVANSCMVIGLTDNASKAYGNWGDGDKGIAIGWNASHAGTAVLKIMTGDGTTSTIADLDAGTIADAATYYVNMVLKPNDTTAYLTVINLDSGVYLANGKAITATLPPNDLPLYCMAQYGTLTGTAAATLNLFTMESHPCPADGAGMGGAGGSPGSGGTGGSTSGATLATHQQSLDGESEVVAATPGGVAAWIAQFGIGTASDSPIADLNTQTVGGNFTWGTSASNSPVANSLGFGAVIPRASGSCVQIAIVSGTGQMFTREQTAASTWGAWKAVGAAFTGGTLTSALNEAPITTLASAATVAIGAATSNTITITGTTTINGFDTVAAGIKRTLVFQGALTLTYNAATLILPGGANVVTAAGDTATFISLGSGNWRCVDYTRAANAPSILGTAAVKAVQTSVTDTTAGSLLSMGAFGLGEVASVPMISDFATHTPSGLYRAVGNTTANGPISTATGLVVLAIRYASAVTCYLAYVPSTSDVYVGWLNGASMQPWKKMFGAGNVSAFIQTMFDDADAPTALATLGAAPLASPALTGTPSAPTAAAGTNTTQLATTAFALTVGSGYVSKSGLTGGTLVLTDAEASGATIALTGTLTSDLVVQLPTTTARLYCIYNATSGAFNVTVRTGASGGTVAVTQGKRNIIFTNSSGAFDAFNDFDSVALTGTPTAPTAAAATNTTQIATTAFVQTGLAAKAPLSGPAFTAAPTGSADNTISCGTSAKRWSVVYAGTGTISTSDARDKTDVRALTDAEIAAAQALANEIGACQFLDSVATKGSAARLHIGMTVQRAIQVMQDHGLEPFSYGFICYDEWPDEIEQHPALVDEDGNVIQEAYTEVIRAAGNRYSFRVDELTMFISRGQIARMNAIEARLAALENPNGGN